MCLGAKSTLACLLLLGVVVFLIAA
jgi:hypothetical protein